MNTLHVLGSCLTLVRFSVIHEEYGHGMEVSYRGRSYPQVFSQYPREFEGYRIRVHAAIIEVTKIKPLPCGRPVYYGKVVSSHLNDPQFSIDTPCQSGGRETDLPYQHNSIWRLDDGTELIEINYAKYLAKKVGCSRYNVIETVLARIDEIERRLQ